MDNTLENKAKFFAQYWGQKVLRCITQNKVTGNGLSGLMYVDINSETLKSNWYLELTPLSLTSDEDAEFCIGKKECSLRINDANHADYSMTPSGIFFNSMIGGDSYFINKYNLEYLRSRGYALPWMGKSVDDQINDGWIKLKED